MNSLLLFLILLVLGAIAFLIWIIARRLENMCDLSKEDEAVKQSLAEVKSAKTRIPQQNKQPTGEN